jgi:tripartite-type tricarboxylate transporter receptor subunit TctC
MTTILRKLFLACALLLLVATPALAEWPDRPIKLIVPGGPGNGPDVITRKLADALSKELKVPIVVVNKAGAAGVIGTYEVIRSAPDGYTFLATLSNIAIAPSFIEAAKYNIETDLEAVAPVFRVDTVLVTRKDRYPTLASLLSKKGLLYGSVGIGSATDLAAVEFQTRNKITATRVSYEQVSQYLIDLLGGRLDFAFMAAINLSQPLDPQLATFPSEKSYDFWGGIYAPKGTPEVIVGKFAAAIDKIRNSEEFREWLTSVQASAFDMSRKDFSKFSLDELARFKEMSQYK